MRTVLASLVLAASSTALAHEGHGATGFHWHGGDALWLLGIAVAVMLWLSRRGRQ
jgi:hypothetical protein